MGYYPVFLELSGRRCLVIGGGNVSETKITGLLAADAEVTVIAPELTPLVQGLLDEGRIKVEKREYREGDVEGYHLVMVATDDGAVNATVTAEGRSHRIWVNSADDTPNCDFILPSVVRQGQVVVAASTGGASPALARRLREELTDFLAEDYIGLVDLLGGVRSEIRASHIVVDAETWSEAIDARVRALVAQRRPEEARERLIERLGVKEALEAKTGA